MFYQTKHNCSTIQRGNVLPDKSQLFNNTKWKCSTRQNIAVLKYKVEMFSQTKHNCATIKVEMFYQTKHTCSPPYFFVFFFCFVLFCSGFFLFFVFVCGVRFAQYIIFPVVIHRLLFVLFLLSFVFSVLLFTPQAYPFGIFSLFFPTIHLI